MKVAVVIPSLFEVDRDYLKLCVESLRATVDWDIIVVTNGTKWKPDLSDIHGVTTHIHTRDQGQCNATNIGAQLVTPDTDYIMISNSDMYYAPDWNKYLRFEHPVFSPNLVEPVNNSGSAPPFLKVDGGLTLEEFDWQVVDEFVFERSKHPDNQVMIVSESGYNLPFFIKKDFWEHLGGYDINYDPWGSNSDTDLQTRINLAGVTPMRLRDVLVYHFSNKTPTFSPENDAFRHNNFDYFKSKFGFDRDELGSDVWYNQNMLPEDDGVNLYPVERYYEKKH